MDDLLLALTRRRPLQQRVDTFLLNIIPTEDETCYWLNCTQRARTRGHYQQRGIWHPYRLCYDHFNQVRHFLDDLERYRLVDDLAEQVRAEVQSIYALLKGVIEP